MLLRDLVSTLAPKASNRLGPQVSYTAVATSDAIFGLDGTKIGTVPLEDDGIGSSSRSNSSGSSNSISDTTYAGSQLPLSEVYSRVMETCTAMLQHKGTVSTFFLQCQFASIVDPSLACTLLMFANIFRWNIPI